MPPKEIKSIKKICSWCDENYGEEIDGRILCEDCLCDDFIQCDDCSCVVENDDAHYAFGHSYCEECFYENYTYCCECSEAVYTADIFYYNGDSYCEYCYDENYRPDMTDAFVNKELPAHTRFSSNKSFPVNKLVGIEVECCISNAIDWESSPRYWSTTSDGSIDTPSDYRGVELVSYPAQGDALGDTINRLMRWKNDRLLNYGDYSVYVNRSCGLHIHFNCLDYSAREVAHIGIVYKHLEGIIKRIMPPSRQESRWCQNFGDIMSYEQLRNIYSEEDLVESYYKGMGSSPSTEKYNDARYCALNLHSRYYHGTLEFRLHSGTINRTKIVNWIIILNSIIDKGIELSKFKDKEYNNWINTSNTRKMSNIFSIDIIEYMNKRMRKFNIC